jgi:benzoate/toluate 1,2-dioxygenase beta subunit
MNTTTLDRPAKTLSRDQTEAFLYAEARALDDRDWDTWLTFYAKDCPFWMPTWDDGDRLTEDPLNEMSLIYYPDR